MTLNQRMRLAKLRYWHQLPRIAVSVSLFLLFGMVGGLEAAWDEHLQAEANKADAVLMTQTLADCLNGKAVFSTKDEWVGCMPAETMPRKRT